jgi:TPR repeat protein
MARLLTWCSRIAAGITVGVTAFVLVAGATPAAATGYGDAMAWYGEQAEAGDPEAQYLLAFALEQGVRSEADLEAARMWYGRAAEQGHVRAGYRLALMMLDGRGGPVDRAGAEALLEPLAEAGDEASQSLYGYLLAHDDVDRWVEAYQWLTLAADGGDSFAATNLAQLLRVMSPEEVIVGEALVADWRKRHGE